MNVMNFGGDLQEQNPLTLGWRPWAQKQRLWMLLMKKMWTRQWCYRRKTPVDIQDEFDDICSRTVSPVPSVSSNTSHSEVKAKPSRKRTKSTKTFVEKQVWKTSKETHAGREAGLPASAFTEAVGTSKSYDWWSNQKRWRIIGSHKIDGWIMSIIK